MIREDVVLDALKRFDVDKQTLNQWESQLGLRVPSDSQGDKLYSIHHINLFKNVRKHLALGRSMNEIQAILEPPTIDTPDAGMATSADMTLNLVPSNASANTDEPYQGRYADSNAYTSVVQPLGEVSAARNVIEFDLNELPANAASTTYNNSASTDASTFGLHSVPAEAVQTTGSINDLAQLMNTQARNTEQTQDANKIAGSSVLGHKRFASRVAPASADPAIQTLRPGQPIAEAGAPPIINALVPSNTAETSEPNAETPEMIVQRTPVPLAKRQNQDAGLLEVLNRLIDEKEAQQNKLVQLEKLNSHLYNANSLFQQRLKAISAELDALRNSVSDMEVTKLLNDKSRLHKQLLEVERISQGRMLELAHKDKELEGMQARIQQLEVQICNPVQSFESSRFIGDWHEVAQLMTIKFDNFGMNIEPRRSRTFTIPSIPDRLFGNMAIINADYCYEANPMWQRRETATLCHINDAQMMGELMLEYVLDGVPVAQAIYRVQCQKIGVKASQ
ncbi:MAG: MerR family transcriptional regulator [Vampirovibrionales bacterium]|nr:MerR family transcriptional regulator [Vampirovibrionales bacterium]